MPAWRRIAIGLVAWAALATPNWPSPPRPPEPAAVAALSAVPVLLNPDAPQQRQVGALDYLAGWELSSDDHRFGGISAMGVEGTRVTAISDMGVILHFDVPGTGRGQVRLEPLLQGPGDPALKPNRDVEAMVLAGSEAWLAYENRNQLWRYRRGDWTALGHAAPPQMRDWPTNNGAEAMLRLADGRFLVISESLEQDGSSAGLLFAGEPTTGARAATVRFRTPVDYRITDGAQLPDGRLLLLQRRASLRDGFPARLAIVDLAELGSGRPISGREIARLEAPLTVDNMEALSITEEAGRIIVWLASDDNYLWFQRTLLLKFALRE